MGLFVDLDITTDPAALADTGIDNLAAAFAAQGISNWTANDAALEIILLNAAAILAADQGNTAVQVGAPVFRAFGTKLANIPYIAGTSATASSTWTASDTATHTIQAGTYVTIGGLGFYVQTDTTFSGGSVAGVTLIAADVGTSYNGLSGPVEPVDAIDWLPAGGITITGETAGGQDQESDDDYQDRLAALLQLQAPRPITATDYSVFVLSFPPASGTDQQEVGRATAIDGYDPTASGTFTGTTTSGSANLTAITGGVSANIGPGTAVTGTGIPASTTILSVSGATAVLSANATSSNSAETVTATGLYKQPRTVYVAIAADDGTALNSDTLTAVAAWLQTYREVNFLVYVRSPTYTTVYVSVTVKVLPSADAAGTQAAVQSALLDYLSPTGFGQVGTTASTVSGWINDPVVRENKLIALAGNVPGVDRVETLTFGTSASPSNTADLPIPGPAPLVQSTSSSIVVTTA